MLFRKKSIELPLTIASTSFEATKFLIKNLNPCPDTLVFKSNLLATITLNQLILQDEFLQPSTEKDPSQIP